MKRVLSFFLAVVLSFVLVFSTFIVPARAVVPAGGFAVAGLIAFMSSAGLQLWHDDLGDHPVDKLVTDFETLWGYYEDEGGGMAWEDMLAQAAGSSGSGSGLSVIDGDFLFSYDFAQTSQGFVNFLRDRYQMVPEHEYALLDSGGPSDVMYFTLPDYELNGLSQLNNGIWALPVATNTDISISRPNSYGYSFSITGGSAVYAILYHQIGNSVANLVFCSLSPFTVTRSSSEDPPSVLTWSSDSQSISGVSRPNDGIYFVYSSSSPVGYSSDYSFSLPFNEVTVRNFKVNEMCYVVLAGDRIGTGQALFCKTGKSIFDLVYDLVSPLIDEGTEEVLVPGQSLVVDVGSASDASADDLIQDVVDAVAEGGLQTDIALPQVIQGGLELYPQPEFPDLVLGENVFTFADLGGALTTKFPFCIPWDLKYLVDSFRVSPKPIDVSIDVVPASMKSKYHITGDTSFRFDLTGSEWLLLREVLAWGLIIGVLLELAILTKNFVNNLSSG